MAARLGANAYGKARVRMMKVARDRERHRVREITVRIALEGDFAAAHTDGDNRLVIPTDTMKNTVYALGRDHPLDTIESFALHLGRHFIEGFEQVSRSQVRIEEIPWSRLAVKGRPYPTAFARGTAERPTCDVTVSRTGVEVTAGLEELHLLKTAHSGFEGYTRDAFTTLVETPDRLLGTRIQASWTYDSEAADFAASRRAIRAALMEAFAEHESRSVQHTLFAMGTSALAACPDIPAIRLVLPNQHCLLVDLSPFGLENENEVFLPIDDPAGMIEAVVER